MGGIFFDDLDSTSEIHKKSLKYSSGIGPTSGEILAFVKECGDAFVPSYLPILKKRHVMKFTEEQKRWQQLRRGRCEFAFFVPSCLFALSLSSPASLHLLSLPR